MLSNASLSRENPVPIGPSFHYNEQLHGLPTRVHSRGRRCSQTQAARIPGQPQARENVTMSHQAENVTDLLNEKVATYLRSVERADTGLAATV